MIDSGLIATMSAHRDARLPAVRLVRFPELGHSPELEAPAAFAEALLSWMAL